MSSFKVSLPSRLPKTSSDVFLQESEGYKRHRGTNGGPVLAETQSSESNKFEMMKLILFFFLAVVAMASAGILGEGPEVYSAVTTKQVHSPFATSSSSRVQQFNDYTYVAPVVSAAPVVAAAAPVVAAAAPVVAAAAPVVAAAPLAYTASSNYGYSGYSGYSNYW